MFLKCSSLGLGRTLSSKNKLSAIETSWKCLRAGSTSAVLDSAVPLLSFLSSHLANERLESCPVTARVVSGNFGNTKCIKRNSIKVKVTQMFEYK